MHEKVLPAKQEGKVYYFYQSIIFINIVLPLMIETSFYVQDVF